MKFEINYISKKKLKAKYSELLDMFEDVVEVNDDLAKTNKILKSYIRYLKNKTQRETIGCYFCQDKVAWWHDFGHGNIRVNFCPRCGRKLFTEDD